MTWKSFLSYHNWDVIRIQLVGIKNLPLENALGISLLIHTPKVRVVGWLTEKYVNVFGGYFLT
jgi:hypothetical protein